MRHDEEERRHVGRVVAAVLGRRQNLGHILIGTAIGPNLGPFIVPLELCLQVAITAAGGVSFGVSDQRAPVPHGLLVSPASGAPRSIGTREPD